ncbi:1,6-anhydro-N-acetylmuramyl-L-alanine amidase AmpD [Tepidiphilus olei]|uniref:1,6-anhydro-N-acetylmuramyl-L-alanine amidase AmpD n=1 Tax=Tepidiphilus olei TaxID=2502184 RepID=UPI00115DE52C|nr:1,6-anhydro-N-acetylmuramyl-L-alanine amidase AmpD [Tepidiphilus olei]
MVVEELERWVDRCVASPNCDDRPAGMPISLVVLHAISLPPEVFGGDAVERLFTNTLDPAGHPAFASLEGLRVSAHYFIRRDGETIEFVPPDRRAWHAGLSWWEGRERCNDFSVGIELEGSDRQPFTPAQYERTGALVAALIRRYPGIDAIAGHCHISPGRKTDPGPFFDWYRFASSLPAPLAARSRIAGLFSGRFLPRPLS